MIARYDRSRFFGFNEEIQDFDCLDSPFSDDLIELETGSEIVIGADLDDRMDLVSHRVYSDVNMWWICGDFNGLMDVFDTQVGQRMFFPDMSGIEQAYFENQSSLNQFPESV